MTSETPARTPPTVKLFSPAAISTHTLLFTPLIGGALGALNWRRLGEHTRSRNDALLGVAATVGLLLVAFLVPERFGTAVSGAVGGVTVVTAVALFRQHKPAFDAHREAGGGKAAFWPATLLGLIWVVIVLGTGAVAAIYGPGHKEFEEGAAALDRHDDAAAERAFLQVLALNPGDDAARYNLALSIARQGRLEDALEQLHKIPADSTFAASAHALEHKLTAPPPQPPPAP